LQIKAGHLIVRLFFRLKAIAFVAALLYFLFNSHRLRRSIHDFSCLTVITPWQYS